MSLPSACLAAALLIAFAPGIGQVLAQPTRLERMMQINPRMPAPMPIDEAAVEAAGIRRLAGQNFVVYTDLPAGSVADGLPRLLDQAVPLWCDYFGTDLATAGPWQINAFVMAEPKRFLAAGLLPEEVVGVPTGYNLGHQFWVVRQPDDYYTRHLCLHEATHSFMQWFLDGCGPAWYREGMAELLGLHRVDEGGNLAIEARIMATVEAPGWGRVSVLKEALATGQTRPLDGILDLNEIGFRDADLYSWSWAACEFFSRHPAAQDVFRKMAGEAHDTSPAFSAGLRQRLGDHWPALQRDWLLFLDEMEYGADAARAALKLAETGAPVAGAHSFRIVASQGWQATGISVSAGQSLEFAATGRFQIQGGDRPWPCEAGGVTIRYWRGRPLGQLLAGVLRDPDGQAADSPLQNVQAVGLGGVFRFEADGELVLRINEGTSAMDDNEGELVVTVKNR
jgi:hypothetical protein